MSDMKTVENEADPYAYLASIENAGRREDGEVIMDMMTRITGQPPRMWGDTLIGYGTYDYTRSDGSHHRFFRTGFAPRKQNLVIYIMPGLAKYPDILARLGKHKHSVSCLYLRRLKNIDLDVLDELIAASLEDMAQKYP